MVLVNSISNFSINKKFHLNKLSAEKIPTCSNSALVVIFLSSFSKVCIQSFISVAFRLLIKMKPLILTFPAIFILLVAFSLEVRCISKTFQQKSQGEKRSLPNLFSEDFFKRKNKMLTNSAELIKGG